jgi:hypothetical protein
VSIGRILPAKRASNFTPSHVSSCHRFFGGFEPQPQSIVQFFRESPLLRLDCKTVVLLIRGRSRTRLSNTHTFCEEIRVIRPISTLADWLAAAILGVEKPTTEFTSLWKPILQAIISCTMAKRCRRCQSVTNDQAPYCEACGIDFSAVPAIRLGGMRRFSLSVTVLAIVLFTAYFRNC